MNQARLRIQNVGGLRGEHEVYFNRGRLSIIEGSNSCGKDSIIQALTAALSMPTDCDLDSFYTNEAIKLGVKTDPSNAQEGFVHVLAPSALVELEYGDSELEYVVDSKGTSLKCPNGSPGFLLAGVLSNRSKVIRQLRGQDDRHEPDDFKWAVTELSLAKRYEEVLEFVKEGHEKVRSLQAVAIGKSKENETFLKKKSSLESKLATVKSDLGRLKDEYDDVKETLSDIEQLRERQAERSDKIIRCQADLKSTMAQYERERKIMDTLRKKAEEKQAEYEVIDLSRLRGAFEKQRLEAQEEVARLMRERDSLDGVLNLFVVAESGMDKKGTKCPLCGKGHLTSPEVSAKVKELKQQRDGLNGQIGQLNMGVQQRKRELDNKERERQEAKEAYEELHSKVKEMENDYRSHESVVSKLEFDLKEHESKLGEIDAEIRRLSDKVGVGSKKAQQAYLKREDEYHRVSADLGIVTQKLYETSVEIGMQTYQPEVAVRIAQKWLVFYDSLIEYASAMAENQRRKAAEQFNMTIEGLLERLNFREFRTVMLNKDYRLYVERHDEKRKDYVFQQVRTLSTSEQMSIALILQMALKETYLPHVPFFLIDDIMENFDEGRREEVIAYLQEKAKENDWFVISTRLVQSLEGIRVV